MLRLEKTRKNGDISISIRQKQPFFSSVFCIAFLAALSLHLLGLVVFHIAPFAVNYSDSLFPPVAVASDLGKRGGDALALLEDEVAVPPHLLLPLSPELFIPSIPQTAPSKDLDYYAPAPETSHPFLSLERHCLPHFCPAFDPPSHPLVKIHVSGPLAAFKPVSDMIEESAALASLSYKDSYALTFDVLADGKSGEIVWLQPQKRAPTQVMNKAEKAIKHMRFRQAADAIVVPGKIEIFLQGSSRGE